MEKFSKQKLLNFSALIEQWIKITYQLNQNLRCPNIVQYSILAFSILQPYYFINELDEQKNQIYVLIKISTRPDLILEQFAEFIEYAFVILLLVQFLQKSIFFIFILIVLKFQINVQNLLSQGIILYILQPLIYYQTFLKPYLIIPITSIFFLTFFQTLEQAEQESNSFFQKMFLCVVGESLYFFDTLYFMKILNHPISYKIQKIQQFQTQNLDYLILKFNLIQVIISKLPYSIIQQQILTIFIFLQALVSIIHQHINKGYIFMGQKNIFFGIQSFLLLNSLLYLVLEKDNQTFYSTTIFFILFPIIMYICLKIQEQIDNQNFKSLFFHKQFKNNQKYNRNNINKIIYQLVKILNNCDTTQQYLNFKQSLIFFIHIRKCRKIQCSCQVDINITECSQINGITIQMQAEFMKGQYKQLIKFLLFCKITNSQKQNLLIQIGILLYDFNEMMVSLQILSLLKKQKENSIFNISCLYKFMNQKDNKMNEDTKIRIQLSILEQAQIKLVLIQSQKKFEANLGTSLKAASQSLIRQFLNEFLISQKNKTIVLDGMIECIKKKIEFYEMLDNDSGFSITCLLEKIKQTSQILLRVEKQFSIFFQIMPDQQFQRIYCFFQAQIFNNLLKAFLIKQTDINVKDQQLKYRAIKDLNLQAELNSYIIVSVDENFRTLKIEQSAQNFLKFFGQNLDCNTNSFLDIVPQYYNKLHENSVQQFFQTGQNKFYRSFNMTFMRQFNGLIKQISLCIDNTSFLKIDKFIFACFIQSVNQELPYIVVDQKSQATYFSATSLYTLGLDQFQLKKHIEDGVLHNISITTLIPYFNLFLKENIDETQIFQTFCFFLKPQYNSEQSLTASSFKKDSNFFIWKNKENINCFSVELKIEKINLQNACYFLLELINIRSLNTYEERKKVLDLFKPCMGDSSVYKSSKWKGKHLKIMSVLSFRNQKKRSTLKIQEQNLQKSMNQKENFQNKQLNQSSFMQQDRSQTNLLSCKTRNEQEFYKSFNKSFVESEVVNSPQDKEIKNNKENQNTVDITKQDYKPVQQDRIVPQQLSSSVAGGYRPFFYNKFALLEKMTEKKIPKKIDFFLFFFIGQSMIFFIFSLIVMVNMTKDISYIINNIEMCSLHASIMGPHDLFYSMRVTVSSYEQMYREGFLNFVQVQSLTEPFYQNIEVGYKELQENFYIQLRNSYLQEFFTNIQIDLRFMNENETQLKQISTSFRESLMIILQYQYAHMRTIQKRESTSGKSCQIFLMANYFLFHDKTEEITEQIYQWLLQTKNITNQRGIIFWIILQILLILFGCIGLYNFNQYIRYYDQFLLIFNEFNKKQIYEQLNKYEGLYQKLSSYSEEILKFNLDQELHEHTKTQSQYGRGKTHHFKLLNRNRQQISRYKVYAIIIVITLFYLTYTSVIYIKQNLFISKYEDSLQLYKLIQDLKMKSGSVYLFKEIFLRWNNFTFLTENERTILYNYLDQSNNLMNQYILLSSSYNQNKYLLEDSFSNFFIQAQDSDVCETIKDYLFDFLYYYCEKAFEGTLSNGLTQSLSYITNQIKTQQQVNNFTKRLEIQLYEQEGSQIITRVFFKLSELFLESIQKVSQEMNNFLIFFSLTFMLVSALLIIIIQLQYRKYLIKEYHQIRQSLYLIPKDSILYDECLERYLREIALHQALI